MAAGAVIVQGIPRRRSFYGEGIYIYYYTKTYNYSDKKITEKAPQPPHSIPTNFFVSSLLPQVNEKR
jgi:cellulose synthase/poly-beta-1,6-N-acetylglucosamine synthase-like glycosyltransferase